MGPATVVTDCRSLPTQRHRFVRVPAVDPDLDYVQTPNSDPSQQGLYGASKQEVLHRVSRIRNRGFGGILVFHLSIRYLRNPIQFLIIHALHGLVAAWANREPPHSEVPTFDPDRP